LNKIAECVDDLLDKSLAADPISATYSGVSKFDDSLTDYSPSGYEERARIERDAARKLEQLEPEDQRQAFTKRLVLERIAVEQDSFNAGDHFYELAHVVSPAQSIRSVFDQMAQRTNDDWRLIEKRMRQVPQALRQWQSALSHAITSGHLPSSTQVLPCIEQARAWAGIDPMLPPYFSSMATKYETLAGAERKLSDRLREAARNADQSFRDYADFLETECAPHMTSEYAVGEERYRRGVRRYLGMSLDLEETYLWGWQEFDRLSAEIADACNHLAPGASLDEVKKKLDGDHEKWLHGEEQLVDWLQSLLEHAISELDGTHFDIPQQLRRLDVRIAPPGGPASPYYTGPNDDFTQPGVYWYPSAGRTRFPMWTEISTAYHEGVPGHHLQVGWSKTTPDLTRYQQNLFIAGHGEGWALYAERLMDELGYLERPEYRLDMLLNSMFRAVRVIVDLGMHLQYRIPSGRDFHPGEVWTPDLATQFLALNTNLAPVIIVDEITRYLGWPAQAISYKLGEREWLRAREQARVRDGESFDLKTWHANALSLGALGLEQLQDELAQL
jgi:uncharacterized protein (DUF885 family)